MTFQIRSLALYSAGREPRVIPLKIGALNVITGASKTGKSTILDIIDYCLGSDGFPVAVGVVRRTVRAYALLLQRGPDEGLLVVRFAPTAGRAVSTQFHIRTVDPNGALPELEELTVTADLEAAKAQLSSYAGIVENLHEPEVGGRRPLRATIRHSLFFCLQAQDEVASRSVLFHGQANEYVPQAIRDVLPFFLGAVPPDHLAKVNHLRQLRRELALLERGAAERRALQGPSGRAEALVREAVQVRLLSVDRVNSDLQWLALLAEAVGAPEPTIDLPGEEAFTQLNAQRQELRDTYTRVNASLANLRTIEAERRQFSDRAIEQRSRLSLAEMFGNAGHGAVCPVCASDVEHLVPGTDEMTSALSILQSEISTIAATAPELDSVVARTRQQLGEIEAALHENRIAIEEAERGREIVAQAQAAAVERAIVRGRISMFLGSQSDHVADEAIESKVDRLAAEIRDLESELDSDEATARLASAQSRLNAAITNIADDLGLEHAGSPTRLDIRRLTVIADTRGGPVALGQMGSGENWLGYHLATMLGIHRFFIESARPVPHFLALDQPSQVYFPPDVDDPDIPDDDDRQALERMLLAIRTEIDRHDGKFQIIIVDHADLREDWFQQAVVEKWRGGLALVPESWLEGGDEAT